MLCVGRGFSGLLPVFWQCEEVHFFCEVQHLLNLDTFRKNVLYDKEAVKFSVWVAVCNWVQLI